MEELLAARREPTVVVCGGRIAGFADFYETERGGDGGLIVGNVVVGAHFRGWGVGEFLLRTMERLGRERYGLRQMRFSCFNTDTNGLSFYVRLGYESYAAGRRTDRCGKPCVLLKMRRAL